MKKDYLIIENNVVTNIVCWDGGSDWTPPANSIQIVHSTTIAKVWEINAEKTDFELVSVEGVGNIGFTWDGSVLTTNMPKPILKPQPKASGTTTL